MENGATFLKSKTMVIGRDVAEFRPLPIFIYILPSARFDVGSFFYRNSRSSKMRIFVAHFVWNPNSLIIIHTKNLEFVEQFAKKLTIRDLHTFFLEKVDN